MSMLVPNTESDHIDEAERLAWVVQESINDKNDNISERELAVPLQLGQLHALTDIARSLRVLALIASDKEE